MDDRTVDLIFAGSLETLPPVSSKIVRIFTSSTFTGTSLGVADAICHIRMKPIHFFSFNFICIFFKNVHTDTTMERNTLMAKCYPRIKDYCREKHGLEFQVYYNCVMLRGKCSLRNHFLFSLKVISRIM